ncbi:hypothetical protein Ciccas_011228 [Cichlidogyrus casuarinus]|uniref:Yippee domain-containing protein n=1 Tax=Cichlidogyrus casuarinus TaxID=1844966 RepID=A0ABD2PSN9_9PLAT
MADSKIPIANLFYLDRKSYQKTGIYICKTCKKKISSLHANDFVSKTSLPGSRNLCNNTPASLIFSKGDFGGALGDDKFSSS